MKVEFNKAALSLADSVSSDVKKLALNRLLKDNVALIAVLEALDPPNMPDEAGGERRRQMVCVANTHIHANPELSDVKLFGRPCCGYDHIATLLGDGEEEGLNGA